MAAQAPFLKLTFYQVTEALQYTPRANLLAGVRNNFKAPWSGVGSKPQPEARKNVQSTAILLPT